MKRGRGVWYVALGRWEVQPRWHLPLLFPVRVRCSLCNLPYAYGTHVPPAPCICRGTRSPKNDGHFFWLHAKYNNHKAQTQRESSGAGGCCKPEARCAMPNSRFQIPDAGDETPDAKERRQLPSSTELSFHPTDQGNRGDLLIRDPPHPPARPVAPPLSRRPSGSAPS